ncbi:TIGR00730 family Rossman fold protein [Candidatus Minimicrobia vallesae]|uniref:Cytokinin riboside 5'-monophosphate phosphoribohydrolase n=1 Tax=Candidatus Minimicrobia vallesae TaxID=2841264 RepID=A0A8F1M954_9BACT|nr:TIGR00730 family Rossman fold protein [Candidatus Minimicrobia vallesae]QWQ31161.1 TIGR00730 family Rossman fold protein [Candidatus Minimicrobia vallesae]
MFVFRANYSFQAAMFRLGKVDDEIHAGYEILQKYHKTVTFFGSARITEDNEYYQKAKDLAFQLAKEGYTIITGGSGGIMEAANRGAIEAGGKSIRIQHSLATRTIIKQLHDKFVRIHSLRTTKNRYDTSVADAYVCFPGGFGTMDEICEITTLTQTKKMTPVPIILFDKKFWGKWDDFVRENMLPNKLISDGDEKTYTITEDIPEVVNLIKNQRTCCDR